MPRSVRSAAEMASSPSSMTRLVLVSIVGLGGGGVVGFKASHSMRLKQKMQEKDELELSIAKQSQKLTLLRQRESCENVTSAKSH